jgi:hypothetical protein
LENRDRRRGRWSTSLRILTEQLDSIHQIEGMLRELCGGVSVDPQTGNVLMVGPAPGDPTEGCGCIEVTITRHYILEGRPYAVEPEGHADR